MPPYRAFVSVEQTPTLGAGDPADGITRSESGPEIDERDTRLSGVFAS